MTTQVRNPGDLTLIELQRLIGEQALTIESLRLRMAEMEAAAAKPEIVVPEEG